MINFRFCDFRLDYALSRSLKNCKKNTNSNSNSKTKILILITSTTYQNLIASAALAHQLIKKYTRSSDFLMKMVQISNY